jgi:hypothetical protein
MWCGRLGDGTPFHARVSRSTMLRMITVTPATDADMRGKNAFEKKSLEVVYDNA